MANYFYVKSGGTLTGSTTFTSLQTGAFSGLGGVGTYYDSVYAAATNSGTQPTGGDFILVSDAHTAKSITGASYTLTSGSYTTSLQVIGVSDTAIDAYSPGADETMTGSVIVTALNNVLVSGVTLDTADICFLPSGGGTLQLCDNSINNAAGASDLCMQLSADGCAAFLTNVDVSNAGTSSDIFRVTNGAKLVWNGGVLSGTVPDNFFQTFGGNGGATVIFNGVDLSVYDNTLMLAQTAGANDVTFMKISNCELHANVTLHGALGRSVHRFEMYNCDNGAADKFYRFYIADGTGSAKNNDTVYVTATEAWYGGADKSSIQVDTEAPCSYAMPFVFELPAQYVNLAEGTTDTLTIDLATAETLVKHDLAAFLVYPDGTTAVTPVWVSSGPSATGYYGIDPLDTSTAMPASALGSGDWTGSPGANRYELVLDASGTPGQATAVSVRIEVYKASIGPIYIHPLITVSAT